jgi:hypothetical protein
MGLGNKLEDGTPATTLQAVTVQAVSHDLCEANYKQVGLDRVNDDVMLCAGNTVDGMKDVRKEKTKFQCSCRLRRPNAVYSAFLYS